MTLRSKLTMAVLAGTLALGGLSSAMAAIPAGPQSSFDTVKSVSGTTVTLADGTSYQAPYGYDLARLRVGERVAIIWSLDGSTRDAASITAS